MNSSRQVRIVTFRSAVAVGLLVLSIAATGSAAAQTFPPHEYTLRVDFAMDSYEDALLAVRNHILATLKSIHAFPPGYPKPCRFRFDPPQAPGMIATVTAYGSELADPGAYGILLDADGHYVMLDAIDSPDPRPYLFEIYLVDGTESPMLDESNWKTGLRIVVPFPSLGGAQYPTLIEWLAKGVGEAGAHELVRP